MRITYIGHATLLLDIAGSRILTDPNFDPKLGRILARVSAPGIALTELPELRAVLVTHAHADHLSFKSLAALPRDVSIYAPPPISQWLRRLGYRHAEPLASGATADLGGLRVHADEAEHSGNRYGVDRWRAAANMYLLETDTVSCLFAGDTALNERVPEFVRERLGGRRLDVALLPIGYAPRWKPRFRKGHLTSADALELFHRLDARYLIPYHWGTFNHVTATAFDAIRELRALVGEHHRGRDVRIIEPGEMFDLALQGE